MLRLIGGIVAGIIGWFVVVAIVNTALHYGWSDYATAEVAMTFTLPMMVARLSMSGVASIVGGIAAGWIDRARWAPLLSGTILLLLFIPVHYSLWDKFPAWYHLTFFVSLPLLGWLGGMLLPRKPVLA